MDGPEVPPAVTWAPHGTVLLISMAGAIDSGVADRLESLLRAVTVEVVRALVDVRQVTFFDSVGVNFLARLASGGRVVQLVDVPPGLPIGPVLRAAGLGHVLTG